MAERLPIWRKWRLVEDARVWEAVALSLNIEPSTVQHGRDAWMGGSDARYFEESDEFDLRFEVCRRNVGSPNWPVRITGLVMGDPGACSVRLDQFAAWALSIGWEVPEELREIAAGVEPEAVEPEPSMIADELGTRERDTLLKLIIGMAIDSYHYDPTQSRSTVPRQIAEDLEKHGISVTDDTVRKWLKQAADTVLPRTQPKP